jgi:prevent-host-death family protein
MGKNTMQLSENIKPVSYLKAHATDIIKNLKNGHQPMIITQNGEAAMVIQSVTDYEQTLKTLALLKLLAQSQQAVDADKTVTSSEAFSRLRQSRGVQ